MRNSKLAEENFEDEIRGTCPSLDTDMKILESIVLRLDMRVAVGRL